MTPERVYALLVEANPYAEPEALLHALEDDSRVLHLVDLTGEDMRTIDKDDVTATEAAPPARRSPWIAAVAAVAVVALIGLATFLINQDSSGPVDTAPPTTIDADALAISDAIDAVQQLWLAVGENDIDAIEELVRPGGTLGSAEQRMWGFHAVMSAAGFGDELGDCQASLAAAGTTVSVTCDVTFLNPVFAAAGSNVSAASFAYEVAQRRIQGPASSELLPWADMPDSVINEPMRAMADYLRLIDEDAWLQVCAPAAYGGSEGVIHVHGLAMAPECAELLVPLLPDIARWVEAGRPDVWPTN